MTVHGHRRSFTWQQNEKTSQEAGLSRSYTNHSIRATAFTILDNSGFEAGHIMVVSGHRNEASIQSYSKTDTLTKKKTPETLTEARGTECELRTNEALFYLFLDFLKKQFIIYKIRRLQRILTFFNCNVNIKYSELEQCLHSM